MVALIVVAALVAVILVIFFTNKFIRWRNSGEDGQKRKVTRAGIKGWLINHKPSKRRLIQFYAAVLYNANIKGYISGNIYTSASTKYACVPGLNCYSCPGAVGACPLGALQNALAESGRRAPYYVFGLLALFGIILARTICGFLCPVGLAQELLYKIRTPKLKKSRVTRALSYFKYAILALTIAIPVAYSLMHFPLPAFCKYICPAGTLEGAVLLLSNPNNNGLFVQIGAQFTWKFCVLVALAVGSVFVYRLFCRFICPLGAIYGFFNKVALMGVKVEKNDCTDCGLCVAHCKMDVKHVGDHECINCGECIPVCPTKAIKWRGSDIFLRGRLVSDAGVAEEVKPLTVGVSGAVTIAAEKPATVSANADIPAESVAETDIREHENVQVEETAVASSEKKPFIKRLAAKGRKFWLEFAAWAVALIVLISALIVYNFVDTGKPPIGNTEYGYEVGDTAPDFTLDAYGGKEAFTLSANRGKVTVINFWFVGCIPCQNEMPFFDMLAKDEEMSGVTVVAIHGLYTGDVQDQIDNYLHDSTGTYWKDYAVTFLQDEVEGTTCLTYEMLGGTGFWPTTLIVDEEGKVLYNSSKSFHDYDDLKSTVLNAINPS